FIRREHADLFCDPIANFFIGVSPEYDPAARMRHLQFGGYGRKSFLQPTFRRPIFSSRIDSEHDVISWNIKLLAHRYSFAVVHHDLWRQRSYCAADGGNNSEVVVNVMRRLRNRTAFPRQVSIALYLCIRF